MHLFSFISLKMMTGLVQIKDIIHPGNTESEEYLG